jgi:poly-gamma-glutamate capsule biosynthesis protein CapA/YwtB (metallophosphatase superfamily)
MRPARLLLAASLAALVPAIGPSSLPSSSPALALRATSSSHPVTIVAVGDTILGDTPVLPSHPGTYLHKVARYISSADIAFGNLEGTLTTATSGKCSPRSTACFDFRNPPRYGGYLRDAGFDIMGMANNHSHDFGPVGLNQTVRALTNHGLQHTGLPGEITVMRANGTRVAFVAFAPYPWASNMLKVDAAMALVRKAVSRADLVVVYMHAGAEGADKQHVTGREEYFLGEDRGNPERFAHRAVKNGADLVIASGPHVLRGLEFYRGRLVAYSLANFSGYRNFNTTGVLARSALLRITLGSRGGFQLGRIVSLHLSVVNRPSPDPADAPALMMRKLSNEDFGLRAPRVFADGRIEPRS